MGETTLHDPTDVVPGDYTSTQKPSPLGTMLASAKRVTSKSIQRPGFNGKHEAWMEDAWDMFDLVGEQRFLATTLANRSSQARFFVGKLPADETEVPIPIDPRDEETTAQDKQAWAVWRALTGRGQRFTQSISRASLNMFVAGDCWMIGIPKDYLAALTGFSDDEDDDQTPNPDVIPPIIDTTAPGPTSLQDIDLEDLDWRCYSISEVKVETGSGTMTIQHDTDAPIMVNPDRVIAIRIWRPHPRRWTHADSPTRSSLPVLRELVGLTMHVSAQVDSRLAGAGLLVIAEGVSKYIRAAAGITDDDDIDPFIESLIEAMVTPITDRSNASAIVPLVVTVPDALVKDGFNFMTFGGTLDAVASGLREESIRRLALGQDCPPELLLGTAGVNHWGAWLVREDVVTTHIEPGLALLADAFTTQYLWPVLEAQGMDKDTARDYVVWYDVSHLVLRPNRTQDAITLHSVGALSDEALRDTAGFDSAAAPTASIELDEADDPIVQLALQMANRNPTLAAHPGIPNLADQLRVLFGMEPKSPLNQPDVAMVETDRDTAPVKAVKAPEATTPASDVESGAGDVPATENDPAPSDSIGDAPTGNAADAQVLSRYLPPGSQVLDVEYHHGEFDIMPDDIAELTPARPGYINATHGG